MDLKFTRIHSTRTRKETLTTRCGYVPTCETVGHHFYSFASYDFKVSSPLTRNSEWFSSGFYVYSALRLVEKLYSKSGLTNQSLFFFS